MHRDWIKPFALALALAGMTHAARADLVVVVSGTSEVEALSAAQVASIFMGKARSFPGGERAVPIEQSEGQAERDAFHHQVTGKDAAQIKAYWSRRIFSGKGQPPREAGDGAAVKAAVASAPGGIGYLDESLVDGSLKVVLKP